MDSLPCLGCPIHFTGEHFLANIFCFMYGMDFSGEQNETLKMGEIFSSPKFPSPKLNWIRAIDCSAEKHAVISTV